MIGGLHRYGLVPVHQIQFHLFLVPTREILILNHTVGMVGETLLLILVKQTVPGVGKMGVDEMGVDKLGTKPTDVAWE